jgi:hypothetical protein
MAEMSQQSSKNWLDLINKSIHSSDDVDICDIIAIDRGIVVIKRGFVNVHYYYIPIQRVKGWDGHILCLRLLKPKLKKNMKEAIYRPCLDTILKTIHIIIVAIILLCL